MLSRDEAIFTSVACFTIGLVIGLVSATWACREAALRDGVAEYNQHTGEFQYKKMGGQQQ